MYIPIHEDKYVNILLPIIGHLALKLSRFQRDSAVTLWRRCRWFRARGTAMGRQGAKVTRRGKLFRKHGAAQCRKLFVSGTVTLQRQSFKHKQLQKDVWTSTARLPQSSPRSGRHLPRFQVFFGKLRDTELVELVDGAWHRTSRCMIQRRDPSTHTPDYPIFGSSGSPQEKKKSIGLENVFFSKVFRSFD